MLPANIRHSWLLEYQYSDSEYIRLTSGPTNVVFENNTYLANGPLMSVGRIAKSIKLNDSTLNVVFAGLDIGFQQQILQFSDQNGIIGRPIRLIRCIYDENWTPVNFLQRFNGLVDSWSIQDAYPDEAGDNSTPVTMSIVFALRSFKEILSQTYSGPFTNQESWQAIVDPTDNAMNIVPSLRDVSLTLGGKAPDTTGSGSSVTNTNNALRNDDGIVTAYNDGA